MAKQRRNQLRRLDGTVVAHILQDVQIGLGQQARQLLGHADRCGVVFLAHHDGASALVVLNQGALVGSTVADVERDLIIETLKHCLGNRTHAANILGISIRTLRNKLKQYDEEGTVVPLTGNLRHAAY